MRKIRGMYCIKAQNKYTKTMAVIEYISVGLSNVRHYTYVTINESNMYITHSDKSAYNQSWNITSLFCTLGQCK